MDSLAERFSVYDFFNPIIVGMTYILAQTVCVYPFFTRQLLEMLKEKKTVDVQVLIIVGFLIVAYIIGAVLQGPAHWFIEDKLHYERDLIENCLSNEKVISSKIRRDFIIGKARIYFGISDTQKFDSNCKDYAKAFFSHCTYYLHINKLDWKMERMRETQDLSKLLTCVFLLVPFISFMITIIQYKSYKMNQNWPLTISEWLICLVLSFGFYYRYKIATKNRIVMTLSFYEATIDNSERK